MIEFTVPLPVAPPTANARIHYMVRARLTKQLRDTVAIVGNSQRAQHGWPPAIGPRAVTLTLIRPSGRLLDSDAVSAALKPCRDALQPPRLRHPGCSLIVGDSPAWATFTYRQERGPLAVRITVIDPTDPADPATMHPDD